MADEEIGNESCNREVFDYAVQNMVRCQDVLLGSVMTE